MLKELRFVMGAVSNRDLVPGMTHFKIGGGFVRGFNGMLALCAPLPFSITCAPKAAQLVQAIQRCEDTIHLSLTPTGRLSLRSGPFKALIECVDGELPHVEPEGAYVAIPGEAMLRAFKTLAPLMGDDASRPWCNGILLCGTSAYATNNILAVEYHTGAHFPPLNVPRKAVKEILRIGEAPIKAQCNDNSLTLHYEDGRWLRTQLLSTAWPDMAGVLGRPCTLRPVQAEFFDAVRAVQPFVGVLGLVHFVGDALATGTDPESGARFDVPGLPEAGMFNAEMLLKLDGIMEKVDWSDYPKPCLFQGQSLRGAIVGARSNG